MGLVVGVVVFVGVGGLLGAGGQGSTVTVTIKKMTFTPGSVVVHPGDTVVWVNEDDRDHTVQSSDLTMDSGPISPGGKYSHVFGGVGKFAYGCAFHPRMKGVVVVEKEK